MARVSDLARSRNLYPSYPEPGDRARRGEGVPVPPAIDIQEPLRIERGDTLEDVAFRYKIGNPPGTLFAITWHATEEDADAGVHILTGIVPTHIILPPHPRQGSQGWQLGRVNITAPWDMDYDEVWGRIVIYAPESRNI